MTIAPTPSAVVCLGNADDGDQTCRWYFERSHVATDLVTAASPRWLAWAVSEALAGRVPRTKAYLAPVLTGAHGVDLGRGPLSIPMVFGGAWCRPAGPRPAPARGRGGRGRRGVRRLRGDGVAGDPGAGGPRMTDVLRPWTVLAGDCRETLRTLPAESIDACVTDTPYGLSTLLDPPNLNKEAMWRKLMAHNVNRRPLTEYVRDGINAFIDMHEREPGCWEMLDVVSAAELKRTMEGPAIERLMRAWIDTGENPVMNGRGFMGKEWDALVPPPNLWREVWRVMKPGAYCLAFGGTRTYALIEMALRFADFEIDDSMCTWLYGQGFPKRVRLDLKIDQHFGKAGERPVVGKSANHGGGRGPKAGFGTTPMEANAPVTGPATPDAARFVGWDRALRPGWEPIIVAVKPLRGTIAENALAYGTGGLHVDACRLPRGDAGEVTQVNTMTTKPGHVFWAMGEKHAGQVLQTDQRDGYPANVNLAEPPAA
jgi:hypothetical protein